MTLSLEELLEARDIFRKYAIPANAEGEYDLEVIKQLSEEEVFNEDSELV